MFTADKPLRHVSEDEYGRERYVENLAYAIVTGDDSNGLVVGVEGEWGLSLIHISEPTRLLSMPSESQDSYHQIRRMDVLQIR